MYAMEFRRTAPEGAGGMGQSRSQRFLSSVINGGVWRDAFEVVNGEVEGDATCGKLDVL